MLSLLLNETIDQNYIFSYHNKDTIDCTPRLSNMLYTRMQKVPIPTEIIQRISNPHCSLSPPWVFVARPRAVVLLSSEERFELRSSPLARARSTVTQKRNMRQFAVSDFKNKPSEAKCRTFLVIMSFICMRINIGTLNVHELF